ncbi:P97 family adhesin [Mesomycoplasma ovipneumoniae]|uniref:P97 family adhesin n=1 Tax=Mesomycoplasma ovipneumoniae TaxID=29562 RepID=UPI0026E45506|nr:hypothetical protein [Mesomycoplasma ovipneumoniae]MDO6829769.1 hypothetical protein [Mesomycoplasma ovipneumoniae]
MSKPKQKSLFNVLRKNILSKTGIAVSLFGVGVFTATAVLTTRISYSGNPRENVQNFAKKINLVSFKLGDLSANDDYYSIKNIIFDENGNKQKDLDLSRLVDVFQKTNDQNQKIDLNDEVDIHKPHLKFVDITANDDSRSFEIKYQVKQKLPDQSFVQSDIYSQEISFLQKSQFLRSNFSSKLQKIIKLFQTKFSSLKDKNSTKEFSADLGNAQATLNDNVYLRRAEDISSFLNLARTSKELENKISKLSPQIKHILFDLYNSEENLIPDSNNKIFNFTFEKNQLTNEYAFVDGRGFLNLFLKAEFSLEAQKLLDFPEVKSWIEPVRIVDNEGNSLFTTSKSLIESIELSNTESKKLVNISVLDFLNLLQTKFTLSNFDIKNKKINREIVQIINQVLEKPLNIGLKNSSNKLPNQGVNLVFDPFNVEISKNDSKFDLKLPYRIQISEKFYGKESSEIVEEKLGVLNLENFSIIDENSDQKIDDRRYFLFLNQNFDLKMLKKDDVAKDKKVLPEVKKTQETEESEAKQVTVQEDTVSTESQSSSQPTTPATTDTTSQSDATAQPDSTSEAEGNTQTKKQPKYKYFLLDSNNPYSKKEIDQLIQDNDFEKLSRHLQSISGYNYNYSNHESLIKAWTGTLIFPFDYANSFKADTSLHAQKTGTISLDSTQFLQNPNETGAFYSFLAKQNPRIVVQAFVDFLKTSGLIFNFVDLDRDYNFDWNKIFESARQVKLNSSNFKKFSFNNQYSNLENSGFVSTLFLPKDVKTKISTLKNDEKILESLTSLNLFDQKSDQIAKFEKIDENIANFETLADVISAFYYKAGLLNNYQNWSEIALLDSEIVFEPNDEISLSDLEEIKKQNPSGQNEDISKKYKAINYYYKLGIRDEFGTISTPLFESPKTTLILKTIDEKTAKINEVTKKLDQIIDAIPVSYQTIHLSEEDFNKLTSGNSATTGGSSGSVTVQSALVFSLPSQILEAKVLVKPFSDAEQTQEGEQVQETQQPQVEQQVQEPETEQETQEADVEQEAETTESNGETQTPVETEKQDELTQKLPKFGAEISQILNKSFTSLFTSTEKDSPKLKINIEIKDDILNDPNKKLITIQVGIPESYLEKLTAEETVDQKEKNDETSSDQSKTEQPQENDESTSDQGQSDNGTASDQGQAGQEGNSGSTDSETVQTSEVLASESPASTSPAPAPAAPASPPTTSASPAPAAAPATPPTQQPKEEKYRYSKKFNITVIKQVSTSQTPTDSTPSTTNQS